MLNKHFDLDKFGNKRQIYDVIRNVFDRMLQVYQHPGGLWGPAVFEPDTLDRTDSVTYTSYGGFFKSGQFRWEKGRKIRLDSIFLCKPFMKLTDADKMAFLLVHELAHFVGYPTDIDDYGYNHKSPFVKNVSLNLKPFTAEIYANFAYEAAHPTATQPPSMLPFPA